MYNPYINTYNPQNSIDRINGQIAELEKLKQQIPQMPVSQPTNLTQNFQISPSNTNTLKYANSLEEVQKALIIGDTAFFSNDMSIVWIKGANNDIKTYELKEVILKDEKDLLIESLQLQIKEMKENAKSIDNNDVESIEDEKSTSISNDKQGNRKQK